MTWLIETLARFVDRLRIAATVDHLDELAAQIDALPDDQRDEATAEYKRLRAEKDAQS